MATNVIGITVSSSFVNSGIPTALTCPEGTTLRQLFTQYCPGQSLDGQKPVVNGNSANWDDEVYGDARVTTAPAAQKNG